MRLQAKEFFPCRERIEMRNHRHVLALGLATTVVLTLTVLLTRGQVSGNIPLLMLIAAVMTMSYLLRHYARAKLVYEPGAPRAAGPPRGERRLSGSLQSRDALSPSAEVPVPPAFVPDALPPF